MNAPEHPHTADFDYVRLPYGKGKGGDCTEGELVEWAERVAARLKAILAAQG